MARLYLNSEEVKVPPPIFLSLDQVMKHVEAHLLPPDTVIRQINLDGSTVEADELQNNPAAYLGDLTNREKIEIITCNVREVAMDSVREAESYLVRVESLTPSLAATFRDFPGPDDFENLKQLYDGFYWMNLLLSKLERLFGFDVDSARVDTISLRDHQEKFLGILKQLVAAQEQADYLLIADLLEFEVLPIVPVWKSFFTTVAKSAQHRG